MYDILYVMGCSYTTPDCWVNQKDSYWYKFSKLINPEKIVNHAHIGKCNRSMIRNALRFLLQNKDKKIFFLIGLTGFSRLEYQDETTVNPYNEKNENLAELYIHQYDPKIKDNSATRLLVGYWTYEMELANLLSDIIMLSSSIEKTSSEYLIHNCSLPLIEDSDSLFLKNFCEEIKLNHKIPNLYNNTYYSINFDKQVKPADFKDFGWRGHHGAEGNENYFQYLKSVYETNYLT